MPVYKGSCLCGQIKYQIEGEHTAFYHCHCTRCRKASGTGHASNMRIVAPGIQWLSGASLINSFKVPDAERFRNDFCSNCGSPLPREFPNHGYISLPAGTLDMEPGCEPQARIFTNSQAAWSCRDDLPTYPEYPTPRSS